MKYLIVLISLVLDALKLDSQQANFCFFGTEHYFFFLDMITSALNAYKTVSTTDNIY